MDFMNAVMHHKVHFCTHTFLFWTSSVPHSASTSNPSRCDLPFWTSSVPHSASTSNPPRFDFLFGLHPCLTPLQRPILHALTSFLDFFRASLHLNVQSATLQFHATLCITFPPHSPSSFEYSILEH